jgi:hypothetical protein
MPFTFQGRRGILFERRIELAASFGDVVTKVAAPAGSSKPDALPKVAGRLRRAA